MKRVRVATIHRRDKSTQCWHSKYKLTCEEADELFATTAGQCSLCGGRQTDPMRPHLLFDHDWSLGRWAVRGLLCSRCNVHLTNDRVVDPDARAGYEASPWWFTHRHPEAIEQLMVAVVGYVRAGVERGRNDRQISTRVGITVDVVETIRLGLQVDPPIDHVEIARLFGYRRRVICGLTAEA